ncbi:hypothetical protein DFJ74DRAFT_767744 [Hyaloraphidium curvatum]|nr:hypothetical protein DFJ74DRAFT_767744 [Hyaloraphidium curvatum]
MARSLPALMRGVLLAVLFAAALAGLAAPGRAGATTGALAPAGRAAEVLPLVGDVGSRVGEAAEPEAHLGRRQLVVRKSTKRRRTTTKRRKTTTRKKRRTTTKRRRTTAKVRATTKKILALETESAPPATALRRSFPMGLNPKPDDPLYRRASNRSTGSALFYHNAVVNLKALVDAALPRPAADALPGEPAPGPGDWQRLLDNASNRARVKALLDSLSSPGGARNRRRQANRVLPYAHSISRQLEQAPLPLRYDMREGTYPKLTPVKDQGGCGANVAFSAMAALESTVLVKSKGKLADGPPGENTFPDFSEAHAYFCDWSQSCEGGYDLPGAAEMIERWGATYEECIPYTGARPAGNGCATFCHVNRGTFRVARLGTSVEAIKRHVFNLGAVQTTFALYPDWLEWFTGPACAGTVWTPPPSRPPDAMPYAGHAVAVVGWEEDGTGNGFWLVRNSWGPAWCDGGYFRIAYGADGFAGEEAQGFLWEPPEGDCEGAGMERCGDGSCADTLEACPVAREECAGGMVRCPEGGRCAGSIAECSSTCPDGGVRCWDGACAEDHLSCAGGEFPQNPNCTALGLFTCLDGTCRNAKKYCPPCPVFGLVGCERGGSCSRNADECPSCGAINLIGCGDGTCSTTTASCPATCEMEGLFTCPNLLCKEMLGQCGGCEDAGLATCYDGSCAQDGDHCPTCESLGKVGCPSARFTKICAAAWELCPSVQGSCEDAGLVTCPEGGGCEERLDKCPVKMCDEALSPVSCGGGVCVARPEDCKEFVESVEEWSCEKYGWATCADGACAPEAGGCAPAPTCESFLMVTCPDGHCEFSAERCH